MEENMARMNVAVRNPVFTHEGASAVANLTALQELRRSVLSCLLWEDQFYESGASIADRIKSNAAKVDLNKLADLAIEARGTFNLRHVPLLLLTALIERGRGQPGVSDVIYNVVQRADEMGELLAMYWANKKNKHMIPAQMRKGLARTLTKFNEYQLAKYDRDGAVKLRDVLRLARPTPKDAEQAALWKRAVKRELVVPDTWEVALSGGADKKETFERLIREGQLGYLALLRNLRNMAQAGCDPDLVKQAIVARKGGAQRVFPFRYVAAARAAPQFEPALDQALCEAIAEMPILSGKTIVLVDVSGSMDDKLSSKSDMKRIDAAAALAAIAPGDLRMFTFSNALVEVPPRRGMAGVDAVIRSQTHGGTELGAAVQRVNAFPHDRLIVITDEQSHDRVPEPTAKRAYMINVASYKNGVGYGRWTHIDGFSEGVLRYIREVENDG
jgi:60 kDa SS-A/Ro ribonucleoprotein